MGELTIAIRPGAAATRSVGGSSRMSRSCVRSNVIVARGRLENAGIPATGPLGATGVAAVCALAAIGHPANNIAMTAGSFTGVLGVHLEGLGDGGCIVWIWRVVMPRGCRALG